MMVFLTQHCITGKISSSLVLVNSVLSEYISEYGVAKVKINHTQNTKIHRMVFPFFSYRLQLKLV